MSFPTSTNGECASSSHISPTPRVFKTTYNSLHLREHHLIEVVGFFQRGLEFALTQVHHEPVLKEFKPPKLAIGVQIPRAHQLKIPEVL